MIIPDSTTASQPRRVRAAMRLAQNLPIGGPAISSSNTSPERTAPMQLGLAAWHRYMQTGDLVLLDALIAPDAVFHSPVVHTPQTGHATVLKYLSAAGKVFAETEFVYVRELVAGPEACLEFTAKVDGIYINGIDLIQFDLEGRIADFKVMVRPLKAVQILWQKMAATLEDN
jgi:hypothetical protein